jgi:hypothetical protein
VRSSPSGTPAGAAVGESQHDLASGLAGRGLGPRVAQRLGARGHLGPKHGAVAAKLREQRLHLRKLARMVERQIERARAGRRRDGHGGAEQRFDARAGGIGERAPRGHCGTQHDAQRRNLRSLRALREAEQNRGRQHGGHCRAQHRRLPRYRSNPATASKPDATA